MNKWINFLKNINFILTPLPGLRSLKAACAAQYAAKTTSAFLPVTLLSFDAPITTVCAATAIKPSIWAPKSLMVKKYIKRYKSPTNLFTYTLTTSPSFKI